MGKIVIGRKKSSNRFKVIFEKIPIISSCETRKFLFFILTNCEHVLYLNSEYYNFIQHLCMFKIYIFKNM